MPKTSIELSQLLPHTYFHVYLNSGHGFLFQYAVLFAKHVDLSLDGGDEKLEVEAGKFMAKLA
jgi:hypothetical protein